MQENVDATPTNTLLEAFVALNWFVPSISTIAATTHAHSVQPTAALVPQSLEHARFVKDWVLSTTTLEHAAAQVATV